jgi:hypothetical protein
VSTVAVVIAAVRDHRSVVSISITAAMTSISGITVLVSITGHVIAILQNPDCSPACPIREIHKTAPASRGVQVNVKKKQRKKRGVQQIAPRIALFIE